MKQCSKCERDLPESSFRKDPTKTLGLKSQCNDCLSNIKIPAVEHLPGMLDFGTPVQRMCAEALIACGSVADAAEAVQLTARQLRSHLSELERAAARRGWSPATDMGKPVAPGFHVKGVSSYYSRQEDGSMLLKGQWVKTKSDEVSKLEALAEAVQAIAEPFKGVADPVQLQRATLSDLLAVYPMGDPHIGMMAWARETGAPFDLEIAERHLVAAADHLVHLAPPCDEALIVNLGDFFHADNSSNETARSHHKLDVDSRWPKILGVGIRIMRRIIDRALEKHSKVRVICEIGNHDDHSSQMLAHCMSLYYERDPRVSVDTSPAKFHWYRFGEVLIGTTHGNGLKLGALPGIMAVDQRQAWGETRYHHWLVGHVHHESVKEHPGCTVETFRTLAAPDAYAASAGYRSDRDMRLDIYHRRYGRVMRHIVGIDQITQGEE